MGKRFGEDDDHAPARPRGASRKSARTSHDVEPSALTVDPSSRVVAFDVVGAAASRALRAEGTLTRARRAWGLPDRPASRRAPLPRDHGLERARVELFIPELLGAIEAAEVRGEHVVVRCSEGQIAYEAGSDDERVRRWSPIESCGRSSARVERDPGRPRKVPGLVAWHSLLKVLRTLVFEPALAERVSFVMTHHRKTGGRAGVGGRIEVDDTIIVPLAHAAPPRGLSVHHVVAALTTYLFLTPEEALREDHVLLAALALLDRRLPLTAVEATPTRRYAQPPWSAFRTLRLGTASPSLGD